MFLTIHATDICAGIKGMARQWWSTCLCMWNCWRAEAKLYVPKCCVCRRNLWNNSLLLVGKLVQYEESEFSFEGFLTSSYMVTSLMTQWVKPQRLGEWDSWRGGGGGGYTIHTNLDLRLGLVSLYIMLPLTPTPPTSHTSQIILPVSKTSTSQTWNVISWSRSHGFEPQLCQTWCV